MGREGGGEGGRWPRRTVGANGFQALGEPFHVTYILTQNLNLLPEKYVNILMIKSKEKKEESHKLKIH